MNKKRLLLLNGSVRKKGTSVSFARTLKILSENEGHFVEVAHVYDYFDGKKELEELAELIGKSDIIAMIAPLYFDTLPYPDLWLLEKLSQEYGQVLKGKSLFAIGQCGFPDITRCEPLLNACMFFAEEAQMNWLGGLGYGGGAIIDGTLLEDLGRRGEKITAGFKLALENVFQLKKIPTSAQQLITLKIPKILYRPLCFALNSRSRKLGKEAGVKDLKVRVYE